jgi:site-specific DNA recombinase
MRTILYARFSSHLQNARSIDDQVAVLTSHAEREGWQIVGVFTDYAISGAAGIDGDQRPGLAALLERLSRGDIKQVFAESTDRLARHEGDAFTIRERIEYMGARLFTLADGEVDDIKGTIKGLFDARFRKDMGKKVKRGQSGTVRDGRAPAGKAYGYTLANIIDDRGRAVRGLRAIDPDQAEIVLRIFTEYAAGQSPRAIAKRLNEECIPGPRGGAWRMTTITGDRQRKNGMLQNEQYIGQIVFNRTSKVRDPQTRRTLIRPNPESEWQRHPAPHLRIVPDVLWMRVQARKAALAGVRPEKQRMPRRLLSGLAKCGICGGGWIVVSKTYWGCGKYKDGGGCSNRLRIRGDLLEARVLAGLSDHLMQPEAVSIYVAERHKEQARLARQSGKARGRIEAELARIDARIANLVEAVATGGAGFAEISSAITAERARRDVLIFDHAEIEEPSVITLHPNFAEDYRRRWADIQQGLALSPKREEVANSIRTLIQSVILTPDQTSPNGLAIEISGKLAEILNLASGTTSAKAGTTTMERVRGIEPL